MIWITKVNQHKLYKHFGSHAKVAEEGLGISPSYYRLLRNYPDKYNPSPTLLKLIDALVEKIC